MMIQTEVLVIGAGPVGLALAGDLGWRGRHCLVVERGNGDIGQPRMDLVGIRTMEYCRRWGLVDAVEASPYDRDYPQDNVYLTALNGYELGRQPMPSMRAEQAPPESPQHRERCPQNMFDPILREFAVSRPSATFWYRHELLAFEQDEHGVTASIRDLATGVEKTVRARFLVGCDGAHSTVRARLGIGMQGIGLLTNTTNVIFRCPEFNSLHDKKPGYRYMFVGPSGIWATIVAINGKDQWRMSVIGNAQERPEYTDRQLEEFAYRALGKPFKLEILSVLRWARNELVADRYREGRIFLCGDSCHLTSPTGGLGMNTGIGDAVTLSWCLSAHLEGWGGPALFDAYEAERRPIAKRITAFSSANLRTMKEVPTSPKLFDDSAEGSAMRARAGHALAAGLRQEWFSMNIHLGNRYTGSPVIVYSEPESPEALEREFNDAVNYRPTSRPGCRAPHAWLADGRSTLDLFGQHFVLLDFSADQASVQTCAQTCANAAREAGMPIEHCAISQADIAALYEKRLVLVRPDGHVAWRGDTLPASLPKLLAKVTGHKN